MQSIHQDDFFLERLEQELKSKPTWKKQKFREESWMTSIEIAEWYAAKGYGHYTEDDVESFLLEKWGYDSLINIRPAKYPHSSSFRTLWGHNDVVYKLLIKNEPRKTAPTFYSSQNKLPENSPIIFLSHNLKDANYAIEVSKMINKTYKYRTWLCEESLKANAVISHEIRKSIIQSAAVLVLLNYKSLGSAYVHSEVLSADKAKIPVFIVIKSDDTDIMQVVEMYDKDQYSVDLTALIEKFKKVEKGENRIERYKYNAVNILAILQGLEPIYIYPTLPVKYTNKKFKGFDKEFELKKRTSE